MVTFARIRSCAPVKRPHRSINAKSKSCEQTVHGASVQKSADFAVKMRGTQETVVASRRLSLVGEAWPADLAERADQKSFPELRHNRVPTETPDLQPFRLLERQRGCEDPDRCL